ncbi:amino acid adenylation domain-containing protein [Tolypothrix sp. VBCCA 56010]|uniref:amino acid adenylation domain-containing protein n=1 Tax=Tolypothrix sp. VBCCA 56010 TaxID=3137731 RepID=UPI003D7C8B68
MDLKNIEEIYTLSPVQETVLADNMQGCGQLICEVLGLNVEKLKQAWQLTVDQQSVLRTLFVGKNLERPRQVVIKQLKVAIFKQDWSSLSLRETVLKLDNFLESEREQLFRSSSTVPLARLSVCRMSEQVYQVILTYHHLILDKHSCYLLLNEIFANYQEGDRPTNLQLKESLVFKDYINWLKKQDKSKAEVFWKSLKGVSAPTPLVIEQYLGGASGTCDRQHLKIPATVVSRCQLSLNILVQGAYALLLSRYTGEEEVVFGIQVAGRPEALQGSKSMLGAFENIVPIRVRVCPDVSVSSWLQELQAQQVNLQQYEYNSIQQIRDWSNINLPIFSSYVGFEDSHEQALMRSQYGSISVSNIKSWSEKNYAIAITARSDKEKELTLEIIYDRARFESGSIARLLGHLQTLIASMVTEPEKCLAKLPLLTEQEQQQLTKWNNTKTDYPQDKCIHQLIEAQAEQTPEQVAVVFEDKQLTYQELNQRANQLAHYLQAMGVGPDVLVGICVERSLEMVVGILGILKAGGAYIPIDPSYPLDRISFILEDAQPPVLLTQEHLEAELPAHWGQVICLDSEWEEIADSPEDSPSSNITAENLVYAIYTSGSTGKPKGVLVTHQNLVHSTSNRWTYYQEPPQSFLLLSSFAFDSSVAGIFWTLCQGGTLVLPPQQFQFEPLQLATLIAQHQVSYLLSIPSLYAVILEQASPQQLEGLQAAIVAGEPCPGKLIEQHRLSLPDCGLFNEYGPTEGTVWSSVYNCQDWQQKQSVPIGCPIANTQIYILDRHLQPVPIGIKGEMYIGGAGIARGYLNRPELTQSKFIADPFSDEPDARLYKTGDLARYRDDGNIEFLGRIDEQVKIRGFRIELGEIEAVLGQHQGVKETAVIVREDEDRQRLIAYIVPLDSDEVPTASVLRDFLKRKLTEYMVPATFVSLEVMPLTPNGKIDRRALPTPQDVTSSTDVDFAAPRTPQEKCLAAIWSELLRRKQVSIHDNFFELGGDSIVSIQMIARANQAGLILNPKQLFEYQTIAKLAALAGSTISTIAEQGIITGVMPLTPIQHWFWEQNLPEPHHFNQSILLEVSSKPKPELLKQAVQQLLVHHDALRLRNALPGQQAIAPVDDIPFEVINLSDISAEKQPEAIASSATEIQASLNLATGPIMRVVLFKLGEDRRDRLFLVIHHLAVDGISWRILLEDLNSAYQQGDRRETIQLPPKTTSFQDWAYRLIEYAQSATVLKELDYWKQQYISDVTAMPVDFPDGKENNTVASSQTVSVSLSVEQTCVLLQEVPSAYNTQINDVLLTALAQSFAKWTDASGLFVELEGHGREQLWEDVDLSRTVGWFTSRFPVMLQLGETVNQPGEALKIIKEQLRNVPAKGIGYGILRYLNSDTTIREQLKNQIQPEVSFNYLGQFDSLQSESIFLGFAQEDTGLIQSASGKRRYLLELNGLVVEGKFQLDWTYSENIHKKTTIENLANDFIKALNSLIEHCVSPDTGSYTPSDFPDVALSQSELDNLVAEINW